MALLPFVVDRTRTAIDVGANTGSYTHQLLALGVKVVAVEANPHCVNTLTSLYGERARIVWAAASSEPGTTKLRIPLTTRGKGDGIATVEPDNQLNGTDVETVEVKTITLDELDCGPVGFIKIDVEGHEESVLRGAQNLLQRDHPCILVEAEERHRKDAVKNIQSLLGKFGYQGFMHVDGRLELISHFDPETDQHFDDSQIETLNAGEYRGRYINNFLFLA